LGRRDLVNVILIAIDTLRADHLSCYGYYRKTTPTIDSIASEGVVFEDCIAPGIPTHPAYTTIFTGLHPLVHKIVCHAGNVQLSWSVKTLPELLYENGYFTVAVDNLAATRGLWFTRGFEAYLYSGGITVISKGAKVSGEIVTERTVNFLRAWREGVFGRKPLFLFVHYWDPHTPYLPPLGYRERFYEGGGTRLSLLLEKTRWGRLLLRTEWIRQLISEGHDEKEYVDSLYDEEILYVDWCVSRLIEELKKLEVYDDSLLIITADHGEGLGENNVYYDHHGLYEWDIRVPLIMRSPSILPRGKRVSGIVTHEDLFPTVLEAVGVRPPKVDGRSLLPLIRNESEARRFVICVENTRMTKRAIRTRRWKLIETLRPDIYGNIAGHLELYDLQKGEKHNLIEEERTIAGELMLLMEEWYRRKLGGEPDPLITQPISLPVPE